MTHKLTIEPESVQETMLIPLWGRAQYSHLYPELLDDPRASEIMGKIDYDFSKVEKGFEDSRLSYLIRARTFDAVSKVGLWFANRMVKKTGNTGAEECV